jgi:nitrite reductase/ring-hydroxylating ferredoxin subunit
MERRDFLTKLGVGAAFALTSSCLSSCAKIVDSVDFTIDLNEPAFAALKVPGGYVVTQQVVVAHGIDGNYYAATVICSHDQQKKVTYDQAEHEFYCTAHGARFDLQGNGKNSTGSGGLTVYGTALSGNTLRVFSV